MTKVVVRMPECGYKDRLVKRPAKLALWKSWVGRLISINEVIDPLPEAPCDTDKAFEVVEPEFLKEYWQLEGSFCQPFICRHMIEAGD